MMIQVHKLTIWLATCGLIAAGQAAGAVGQLADEQAASLWGITFAANGAPGLEGRQLAPPAAGPPAHQEEGGKRALLLQGE